MTRSRSTLVIGVALLLSVGTSVGWASTIMFTGSGTNGSNNSQPLSAEAVFSLTGNVLTITLINSAGATSTKYTNSDLLTGIFFSSTALNLVPVSAQTGNVINNVGAPVCSSASTSCDVGNGWEYLAFSPAHFGAVNGVSAAGLGIFGSSNFGGSSTQLQGDDYGIVPANYPGANGTSVAGSPLEKGSVIFTLIAPPTFTLSQIDTVTFRYGSTLADANLTGSDVQITATPEPMTCWLIGGGLIALGVVRWPRP